MRGRLKLSSNNSIPYNIMLLSFLLLFIVPFISCQTDGTASASSPCDDSALNDCDSNAECIPGEGDFGAYTCNCTQGFVDVSQRKQKPGRLCNRIRDECASGDNDCHELAECIDTLTGYKCACVEGYRDDSPDIANVPGRVCVPIVNECPEHIARECHSDADCVSVGFSKFGCRCRFGFIDKSPDVSNAPGRVCEEVKQECESRALNDCHDAAICIDLSDGYTCACQEGFRDISPASLLPGRQCIQGEVQIVECNPNDPSACDSRLSEVCTFESGGYRCSCPPGVSRLTDRRCKLINECSEPRLNHCSVDATCVDTADSYTCHCNSGFADVSADRGQNPGRRCRPLQNECKNGESDCDGDADCVDTQQGFQCHCRPGFEDISHEFNRLPGRRCIAAVNECKEADLNDCSSNAVCEDSKRGYTCRCSTGFIDASPDIDQYPGRVCNPRPEPPSASATAAEEEVVSCNPDVPGQCKGTGEKCLRYGPESDKKFACVCPPGSQRFEDGTCKIFDACSQNSECSDNAICTNLFDGYKCQCKPGFLDRSPHPLVSPGRVCVELINECGDPSLNDCDLTAHCVDKRHGYSCKCPPGLLDYSSSLGFKPGRKCANATNECASGPDGVRLNSCSENADCIDTPEGYDCVCAPGFIDVSNTASLPPGRVCTVETVCNQLQADLIFLVDGSGSIGSWSFAAEVLRFVREFIELFDVGLYRTRVGMIQFSDRIRHEFDLNQYRTKAELRNALQGVTYLTGLTHTGTAIEDLTRSGFAIENGARPISDDVARIAVVITDGRSQDDVLQPSIEARRQGIRMFAIGVTDHVLESELEKIAGSREGVFTVKNYTELDTRLRSVIQKEACQGSGISSRPKTTECTPDSDSCDRTLNEACLQIEAGGYKCGCPKPFQRHPITGRCGGEQCNPRVTANCGGPHEDCRETPFGTFRCCCASGYQRGSSRGDCGLTGTSVNGSVTTEKGIGSVVCQLDDPKTCTVEKNEVCRENEDGVRYCGCPPDMSRNNRNRLCGPPKVCNAAAEDSCDKRLHEECLVFDERFHTCQCPKDHNRHPITETCLINECTAAINDCHEHAECFDTDESYICSCPQGYLDISPDLIHRPGRVCIQERRDCLQGRHNCSSNARCTDIQEGFLCDCLPGYVDRSPNQQFFRGTVCEKLRNECIENIHDCSENAECVDTTESFVCICKPGFIDQHPFENPGRECQEKKMNLRCKPGNNDCDRNAECFPQGDESFTCRCRSKFIERSPNPISRPGRICVQVFPECDSNSFNDCDPAGADCIDTDDGYRCRCKSGFFDIDSWLNPLISDLSYNYLQFSRNAIVTVSMTVIQLALIALTLMMDIDADASQASSTLTPGLIL